MTHIEMHRRSRDELQAVLHPVPLDDFVSKEWGKQFVHLAGPAGKFSRLYDWERLNDVLAFQRIESPRLRLFKNGKEIAPLKYRAPSIPGRGHFLRSKVVLKALSDGATLIIDEIDETSQRLRSLMLAFEDAFKVKVHTNLYAVWGVDNGFPIHWDPCDTFVLQISGRKRWTVWKPTRLHPLMQEAEKAPEPTEPPIFDADLIDGSLLYVPRGWWHVVRPVDEPSLHLTVTINSQNGTHLLMWLLRRLRENAAYRMDVPRTAGYDQQLAYVQELRKAVADASAGDLIHEFLVRAETEREPRPEFCLPNLTV